MRECTNVSCRLRTTDTRSRQNRGMNTFLSRNGELVIAVVAIVIALAGGVASLGEPFEKPVHSSR